MSGAPGWGVFSADCAHPRVWLVAGLGTAPEPTDQPTVRDDLMRTWRPGPDGRYTTGGGRHHATWGELRARHDLVEVTEARMAEAIWWGTP
ncbi:MAG: hypothetical protein JO063_06980 [Pseudonocardiales bacterium]|nr:hypothetical protein [Pseudonocardiales bacterium]MBV9030459.1 hypothetical protein [Pseudonocardiales bacterium]MBW0009847.1 hypothetical protein [Pseudonocardiales bacterium]